MPFPARPGQAEGLGAPRPPRGAGCLCFNWTDCQCQRSPLTQAGWGLPGSEGRLGGLRPRITARSGLEPQPSTLLPSRSRWKPVPPGSQPPGSCSRHVWEVPRPAPHAADPGGEAVLPGNPTCLGHTPGVTAVQGCIPVALHVPPHGFNPTGGLLLSQALGIVGLPGAWPWEPCMCGGTWGPEECPEPGT